MTKKDYEMIARKIKYVTTLSAILSSEYGGANKNQIMTTLDCLEQHLSGAFLEDNPRFDRKKFIKASGLGKI